MAVGRSSEGRTVTVTTTSGSANITAPAGTFSAVDVGRTIFGTGIVPGTTILSVQSATAATMSTNATASGSPSAAFGPPGQALGFVGWSPETSVEAGTYDVDDAAAGITPDRLTDSTSPVKPQRTRTTS